MWKLLGIWTKSDRKSELSWSIDKKTNDLLTKYDFKSLPMWKEKDMKIYFTGIIILFSTLSLARTNYKMKDLIFDEKNSNGIRNEVGAECFYGLKEFYTKGYNLSNTVVKSKSITANYYYETGSFNSVYHWTSSNYVSELIRKVIENENNSNYSMSLASLFSYPRNRYERGQSVMLSLYFNNLNFIDAFYVASNPYSSSMYGQNLIEFVIDKEALVFKAEQNGFSDEVSKKIIKRMKGRKYKKITKNCNMSDIFFFLMEDNDIALVDYSDAQSNPELGWFYFISPEIIRDVKLYEGHKKSLDPDEVDLLINHWVLKDSLGGNAQT